MTLANEIRRRVPESNEDCPRCGAGIPTDQRECPSCGVILAKARARGAGSPGLVATAAFTSNGLDRVAWRALMIGGALALVLPLFPFLDFIFTPLITIVHELGHTVVNWGFGYPAYPAFDFSHGGGVTVSHVQRSPLIVVLWFIGLAGLAARWWPRLPLVAAALGVALVYAGLLVSVRAERTLIAASGHAFELLLAAVFLYRGAAGVGCRGAERAAYAFAGLWIAFHDAAFGWTLATQAYARALYEEGKRGIDPDLVTTARYARTSLARVAGGFTTASILTPAITLLLAHGHEKNRERWDRIREAL